MGISASRTDGIAQQQKLTFLFMENEKHKWVPRFQELKAPTDLEDHLPPYLFIDEAIACENDMTHSSFFQPFRRKESGAITPLIEHRHEAGNIAEFLAQYAGLPLSAKLSVGRRCQRLAGLKTLPRQEQNQAGPTPEKIKELEEFFRFYIPLIDDAFFMGILQTQVKEWHFEFDNFRQPYWSLTIEETMIITIVVNLQDLDDRWGFENEWEHYLAIFLHESLRLILFFLSCKCLECQRKVGNDAHGRVWIDTMLAIQQSWNEQTGMNLNCNVAGSIAREISESFWRPTDQELAEWGVQGDLEIKEARKLAEERDRKPK